MNLKYYALIVLGVLGLVFLVQNSQVVTFHFLFWKISMSQIILFFLCILAGFAAGFFLGKRS